MEFLIGEMTPESRKNLFAVDWPGCLEGRFSGRQQSNIYTPRILWTLVFGNETYAHHAIHAPRECTAREHNFPFQLAETEGSPRRALQLQEHIVESQWYQPVTLQSALYLANKPRLKD
jgi:hypothetical protein